LIHWKPLDTFFDIDETHYKLPGRWDCIYTIPAPSVRQDAPGSAEGYPRYGFWTASPKSGMMGFGITHDGINWQALPSPQMLPPLKGEVGAVEFIRYGPGLTKSGYYAILGTSGHMVTYNASSIDGPYHAAAKNFVVLPGAHSCYFARFFYSPALELLVTHQTFSHVGRTYVSPFKRAIVDDEGILRFGWWPANEGLKGAALPSLDPLGKSLSTANASTGFVIEATLKLPPANGPSLASVPADTATLPGFIVETSGGGAIIATVDSAARVNLATVANASAPVNATIVEWGTFDRELDVAAGATVAVRLLSRRDMLELYLNDILMPVYLMPPTTGRIGLLPSAAALLSTTRVWAMSLPGHSRYNLVEY